MINRIFYFVASVVFLTGSNYTYSQRYLSEIFPDVTVTSDIVYANNVTVETGAPVLEDLLVDIYEPTGDTETARPLIIVAHDGDLLPSTTNGTSVGEKTDSAIVEICNQFAKRGYVIASITYRLGWNSVSTDQNIRTGTFVNALYRGSQDMRTAVRYFRKEYATYSIDTSRIIIGGSGTGATIAYSVATLDDFSELELNKFLDLNSNTPYVDTNLISNIYGTTSKPINLTNHVDQSSDVDFMFALDGFCPDSSWLELGDVPMVGFHTPSNPFAPYNYGQYVDPINGNFVLGVSGSGQMLEIANNLGNQNIWDGADLSGTFTTVANAINNGNEGLYPFYAPTPTHAPWQWWDPTNPNHGSYVLTNPNMSSTNGKTYIDSIMGYLNKRIVCALDLPGCNFVGLTESSLNESINVYPNPTDDFVVITTDQNSSLTKVTLRDLTGKELRVFDKLTVSSLKVSKRTLPTGIYLLEIDTIDGLFIRKVQFY